MPLVVGVTFRRVGKVYYFDPGDLDLHEGDFVIAETARGVEFGEVVIEPRSVPEEELVAPLKKIVRVANGDDLNVEATNRDRERHAFEVCEKKIAEHNLPMKLLEAEYAFDGSQVTFSFSADGRIDFRELVKDVAGALRTKVQLHQIGVRDEAKLIGGYGTCGRSLCCATFLSSFDPISMKMAKDQSLFLNPAKFSGACGKLMCCLRYEHEFYKEAQRRLPAVGAILQLPQGRAKVIDVNVVSNVITVQTEEDVQVHIHADQIELAGLCRRHGIACNMSEPTCQPLRPDDDSSTTEPVEDDSCNDIADDVIADIEDIEDEAVVDVDVIIAVADIPPPEEPPTLTDSVAMVTRWRTPGSGPGGGFQTPPEPEQSKSQDGENQRSRDRQNNQRQDGRNRGGRNRSNGRGRNTGSGPRKNHKKRNNPPQAENG